MRKQRILERTEGHRRDRGQYRGQTAVEGAEGHRGTEGRRRNMGPHRGQRAEERTEV